MRDIARAAIEKAKGRIMTNSKAIIYSQETAARMAQRVNALDGLSDDALDGGWNFKDYERYVVNLEKQRKELLEALINALPMLHTGDELPINYYANKPGVLGDALRAIAKAKADPMEAIRQLIDKAKG